jgi:hypothetical protein
MVKIIKVRRDGYVIGFYFKLHSQRFAVFAQFWLMGHQDKAVDLGPQFVEAAAVEAIEKYYALNYRGLDTGTGRHKQK